MQKRKAGQSLPSTGFVKRGHRSHVSGVKRLLSGKKASPIKDALTLDAKRLEAKFVAPQRRTP